MPAQPRSHVAPWLELLAPALLLGVLVWTMACSAPLDAWAQPRLASAYALRLGQDLYPDLRSGAQLCWLYGPVFPLWMLPVTLIPSLAWAEALAVMLNAAAPLAALAWCLRADTAGLRPALARTAWTVMVLSSATLTAGWFGGLHVDPPCIALMLVSLGAARRHLLSGGMAWLHLAAGAAVLAFWTKQTAAAFPLVLAGLWAWERRWPLLMRWSALGLGYGLVTALLIGTIFGFARVWFYVFAIHTHLPWRDASDYFAQNQRTLLLDFLPWVALALLPSAWRRLRPRSDETTPSPIYASIGLGLLPFGFAAVLKEGGGFNSAHGMFFLAIALGLRLQAADWPALARSALIGMLSVLALVGAADRLNRWTPDPYQDRLLAVVRQHPGRIYLPWNPLPTLLSDGKIYPFEYALFARQITGTGLSPEQIRAALPAQPVVLYDPLAPTRDIARYLPEAKPVTLPALSATTARP
jgi:hypothetical protein